MLFAAINIHLFIIFFNKNIYRKSETESTHKNPASRIRKRVTGQLEWPVGPEYRSEIYFFRSTNDEYSTVNQNFLAVPTFY
jgi:hypothetical protein